MAKPVFGAVLNAVEETAVAAEPKAVKNIYTITQDVIYTSKTQPYALKEHMKGKDIKIKATHERKMALMFTCLTMFPEQFDSLFNVEVRPPYDYQTEHFAKELVDAINFVISKDGEIGESQIESLQKDIYKLHTYSLPLGTLLTELAQHQDYVDYLLRKENKVNVTEDDYKLVKKCAEKRRVLTAAEMDLIKSDILTYNYKNEKGYTFILHATIPSVYHQPGGDASKAYGTFFTYLPSLTEEKININTFKNSHVITDIGLAAKLCELTGKTLIPTLYIFDDFENVLTVSFNAATMAVMIAEAWKDVEKVCNAMLNSFKDYKSFIDSRVANGTLTI